MVSARKSKLTVNQCTSPEKWTRIICEVIPRFGDDLASDALHSAAQNLRGNKQRNPASTASIRSTITSTWSQHAHQRPRQARGPHGLRPYPRGGGTPAGADDHRGPCADQGGETKIEGGSIRVRFCTSVDKEIARRV